MPVRLISSVRGMGVAVSVRTSTSARNCLMDSLCDTPKRCSSSTTSSPSFLKVMSPDSRRWVPITTSTSPVARRSTTERAWAAVRNRDSTSTFTGKPANRSVKVWKCCCASSVVGTSTATCWPSCTALNAARSATSVLPNPTSPHTSRSIGTSSSMSALTAWIAES